MCSLLPYGTGICHMFVCVCVCVCVCARARAHVRVCVRACVCVGGYDKRLGKNTCVCVFMFYF